MQEIICPICGRKMKLRNYTNERKSFGEKGNIISERWVCEGFWKDCSTSLHTWREE